MLRYNRGNIEDKTAAVSLHGGAMPGREASLKCRGLGDCSKSLLVIFGNGAGHMAAEAYADNGARNFVIIEPDESIHVLSLRNKKFYSVICDENASVFRFHPGNISFDALLRVIFVKAGLEIKTVESAYMSGRYNEFRGHAMRLFSEASAKAAQTASGLFSAGFLERADRDISCAIARESLFASSRGEAGQ